MRTPLTPLSKNTSNGVSICSGKKTELGNSRGNFIAAGDIMHPTILVWQTTLIWLQFNR